MDDGHISIVSYVNNRGYDISWQVVYNQDQGYLNDLIRRMPQETQLVLRRFAEMVVAQEKAGSDE